MCDIKNKIEKYREYLNQDKSNLGLLCNLIDLEIQAGYFSEVNSRIESALEFWPNSPELAFRQATLFIASGEFEKAILILEKLIESGVDNEALKHNLAYAYVSMGLYVNAKQVLSYVTIKNVDLHESKLLYSKILHYMGDVEEAIIYANEFVELQPDNADALGSLSLMYFDIQDNEHSKYYAEEALRFDHENKDGLVSLGSISLADQQLLKAKECFLTATEKYPYSGRSWSGLGLVFMMEKNLEKAIEVLKNAVTYMPNHIGTWHALAWCELVSGKIEDAESSFNSAMKIDHNFGETHGGLAVIKVIQSKNKEAERLVKVASKLDPSSLSAKFAKSLLQQTSDPEESARIINEILTIPVGKNNENLNYQLAKMLVRKNNG